MMKKNNNSISRAQIHFIYTQTIKYRAAEIALIAKISDCWSKYRKPILHNANGPEHKKRALQLFHDAINELLQSFHTTYHVEIHIAQLGKLDQDFPFNLEMEYLGDDIPFTKPSEAGTDFPLRTIIFDLNSGLDAQLISAKEFLKLERIKTSTEFNLESKERRTNLSSIYRNLSFLVEKDKSKKTYEELSSDYNLSVSTLKSMYKAAQKLLNSGEIHRLFSPFPPGNQPRFKLTLKH
jgi:hypothetical protein